MRACWPLVAICLLTLCPNAMADTPQQAQRLDSYRIKAVLPGICAQIGGNIVYGTHARQCQLPTVTRKIPSAMTTASRALPVTIKH